MWDYWHGPECDRSSEGAEADPELRAEFWRSVGASPAATPTESGAGEGRRKCLNSGAGRADVPGRAPPGGVDAAATSGRVSDRGRPALQLTTNFCTHVAAWGISGQARADACQGPWASVRASAREQMNLTLRVWHQASVRTRPSGQLTPDIPAMSFSRDARRDQQAAHAAARRSLSRSTDCREGSAAPTAS
jgi:hypothetical protein